MKEERKMSGSIQGLAIVAAVGCGVTAGVWFAFSGFVMQALDRLQPAEGIDAMNQINKTAVHPPLMILMFGTALVCVALAIWAVLSLDETSARWILAGSALYLIGTIVVTKAGNVPLNDSLAGVDPHGAGAAGEWSSYVSDWTRWNTVRGITGAGAAASFVAALLAV
jgi:uncharacterized membrane protein